MDISLGPELEGFVQAKVREGGFASPADVVRSALEMWKAQEELTPDDVDELRSDLALAVEQSRRGQSTPLDMQEIKEEVRRLRAAR
jgi:putative addiction module CopG family antidote